MNKKYLQTGALLGAVTVAIGAFAAHGLKEHLNDYALDIFGKGVTYQFYHTIAILVTGIVWQSFPNRQLKLAFWFFLAGILLFSGSLYALALLVGKGGSPVPPIGAITPLGGLCFIAGWLFLFVAVNKPGQGK